MCNFFTIYTNCVSKPIVGYFNDLMKSNMSTILYSMMRNLLSLVYQYEIADILFFIKSLNIQQSVLIITLPSSLVPPNTIKAQLKLYMFSNFLTNFDPNDSCALHFLYPCCLDPFHETSTMICSKLSVFTPFCMLSSSSCDDVFNHSVY